MPFNFVLHWKKISSCTDSSTLIFLELVLRVFYASFLCFLNSMLSFFSPLFFNTWKALFTKTNSRLFVIFMSLRLSISCLVSFYQENQSMNVKVKAKLFQVSNFFRNHLHVYLPTVNNRQVRFGRGDCAGWFFVAILSCLNDLALT